MELDIRKPLLRDQVLAMLRQEITARRSVGDRLPAEELLARQLKVSRKTVRAAYAALEAEGLIERRRGAGTILVAKSSGATLDRQVGLVFFSTGEQMFTIPFYVSLIARIYALGRDFGWY